MLTIEAHKSSREPGLGLWGLEGVLLSPLFFLKKGFYLDSYY